MRRRAVMGLKAQAYHVIGLMSGTSGDGVDAALVRIEGTLGEGEKPRVTLLAHLTEPYAPEFRRRLFALFDPATARVDEICRMNVELAAAFAGAARAVADAAGLPLAEVDFIGSHGQTIHHLPPRRRGERGSTLQIGEPAVLAELTGLPVVSNFRARDMAAGGQGAPLVPFADWVILGRLGRRLAVQNIGGIGNVTVLPPTDRPEDVIAFDTGPGNMVIDAVARRASGGRLAMDVDGAMGAAGRADEVWVDRLLAHPYFALEPPKSTGREEFGEPYAERLWAEGTARGLRPEDIVATATLLTARSIADQYRRYVLPHGPLDAVVLGGGGAHNPTLVAHLRRLLHPVPVHTHEAYGIPCDAKEAVAFALLAWAAWCGVPANLPSVTGAEAPRILGTITPADGRHCPAAWHAGSP